MTEIVSAMREVTRITHVLECIRLGQWFEVSTLHRTDQQRRKIEKELNKSVRFGLDKEYLYKPEFSFFDLEGHTLSAIFDYTLTAYGLNASIDDLERNRDLLRNKIKNWIEITSS